MLQKDGEQENRSRVRREEFFLAALWRACSERYRYRPLPQGQSVADGRAAAAAPAGNGEGGRGPEGWPLDHPLAGEANMDLPPPRARGRRPPSRRRGGAAAAGVRAGFTPCFASEPIAGSDRGLRDRSGESVEDHLACHRSGLTPSSAVCHPRRVSDEEASGKTAWTGQEALSTSGQLVLRRRRVSTVVKMSPTRVIRVGTAVVAVMPTMTR